MTKQYPKTRSEVEITFMDGEVRTYQIDAGSGISRYLIEQASDTGVLCFIDFQQKTSLNVPLSHVREWTIKEIEICPPAESDEDDS